MDFPAPLPRPWRLNDMLLTEGLKLDYVLELKVDEEALLNRILNRAKEAKTNGQAVRAAMTRKAH